MVWKTIFYVSLLIAFLIFITMRDKGFSFKNSLLFSLFAPFIGGVLILATTFFVVFMGLAITLGLIAYAMNKKKLMKFKPRRIKFKVYRA